MFCNYGVFDPKLKTNPAWQDTAYAEVVYRAQKVLGKRSAREQLHAVTIINQIMKGSENRSLLGLDELRIDKYSNSPVHVLRHEYEKAADPDDVRFRNGRLADYLAVLALALVREGFLGIGSTNSRESGEFVVDGSFLDEAEEAVDWAERAHSGSDHSTDLLANRDRIVKARIREKRSIDRNKGYTDSNAIKAEFVRQWKTESFGHTVTRKEAAGLFFGQLDDDDIDSFSLKAITDTPVKDRVVRLLLTALRKADKQP